MHKLPAPFEPLLFSLPVSAVATAHSLGVRSDFTRVWLASWARSWRVAFPTVLVVAPVVRKLATSCAEPRS